MHRSPSYPIRVDAGKPSLPVKIIYLIAALSALPFLLMLGGVDFGSPGGNQGIPADLAKADAYLLAEAAHLMLRGSFTHTILEWSAVTVGVITFVLAIAHFSISRDSMVPIIGMALFCAGIMDAFHTLAADRLIEAVASNRQFIPFTWAVSRIFNAMILIVGISVLLMHGGGRRRTSPGFVTVTSLTFGFTAYYIIHISATNPNLPQTMFPDDIVTRPWDVVPLMLFTIVGILSYRLFRLMPSYFSGGLLLSVIPDMATEMYMAFGSTALFDSNFNVAHGLKILSYAIPLMGLCVDYMKTYRSLAQAATELAASQMKNQAIVNVAVNGIITFDENGVIGTFNPAAGRIFGYRDDEAIGQNITTLIVGEKGGYGAITGNQTNGIGRETTGRRKNGSTFPLKLAIGEKEIDGKKLFFGYAVDITARKDAEDALIQAKEKAEKASQAKSSFLSMMSHELRTPLTCIIGNLPLISNPDEMPEPSEIAEIARDISESGDHLLAIINDLLDFSKIESGEMQLERETINVDDIVHQATAILGPVAEQKRLRLVVTIHESADINADPIRIRQIFINLIGNAIKFTAEGEVRVDISTANGTVTCAVRDTGVGVPEEMLPVIFDKFRQVDSSPTRKAEGTGLGLAITKSLIEMHGGKIRAENNADGGSCFSFSLPTVKKEYDQTASRPFGNGSEAIIENILKGDVAL